MITAVALTAISLLGGTKTEGIRENYLEAKKIVYSVFPKSTRQAALRVVHCETGGTYYRKAHNRTSGARGYFQVIKGNHRRYISYNGRSLRINWYRLDNGRYNSRVAYILSRGGTNWREWASVCRP